MTTITGFLGQFARHPMRVGAVAASSRSLAARMARLAAIDERATVVELGPGTGALTTPILEALAGGGTYLGIDDNAWMATQFRRRFPDARLVEGDAHELLRHVAEAGIAAGDVDAVVCGLPWSVMPAADQATLVGQIRRTLGDRGHFVSFAYVHGLLIPGARRFHRILLEHFESVTRDDIVWRNVPPAIVYHCRPVAESGPSDG